MGLRERLILLVIEMSPNKCVSGPELGLVLSVLDKRYGLEMETSQKLCRSLESLSKLHIRYTADGYRLDEGGKSVVEDLRRRQAPFCRKLDSVAHPIMRRCSSRSFTNATV